MLTIEQIAAAQKAQFAVFFGLGAKAVESLEQVTELNLATSKAALKEGAAQAKAVFGAKDPQDLIALQTSFVQPLAEKSVAYGRSLYDIASSVGAEFGKTAEAQAADLQKQFAAAVDSAAKNAPKGSEPAVAAVKTALNNATAAFEAMQKAVKQATEMAEANLSAVAASAVVPAPKAVKAR